MNIGLNKRHALRGRENMNLPSFKFNVDAKMLINVGVIKDSQRKFNDNDKN